MGYAGDTAEYDPIKTRLKLPVAVLRSVGWTVDTSLTLSAGWARMGHIRLYRREWLVEQLATSEAITRANLMSQADLDDVLQVRADRYREVGFGASDSRITFSREVLYWLFGDQIPDAPVRLFAQARTDAIDVMTQAVRIARLGSDRVI